MHSVLLTGLLLFVAPVTATGDRSASRSAQAQSGTLADYHHALFSVLSASKQPRDWAMAAQITLHVSDDDANGRPNALLGNATAASPNDHLVAWLSARHLAPTPGPFTVRMPRAEDAASLVRLEPDNAAAWLQQAAVANARGNEPAVVEALALAATAKDVDTHALDLVEAWLAVYTRVDLPALPIAAETAPESLGLDADAQRIVLAFAAATSTNGVLPLVSLCDARTLTPEAWQRRAVCSDVARKFLRQGPTLLDAAVGAAVLRRLELTTAEDAAAIVSIDWLRAQVEVLNRQPISSNGIRAWLVDWRRTGSEIESQRLALRRAGIPQTPPPAWTHAVRITDTD